MKKLYTIAFLLLITLTTQAQLNGTGYYRFRNAAYTNEYISLTNDLFNYHIVGSNAGGGLMALTGSAGKARAMECAGKYLATDIHMIEDADCINPASVIYAKKISKYDDEFDYNLIGQGTSLLTLTTGTYAGTIQLQFTNRYITIKSVSGSGANTLYTAQIELKATNNSLADLGTRYFVDDNGTFAINTSFSAVNAKWYVEPITHFNISPEVEFGGKYYATLYVPYAFKLSGQVENAYVVSAIAEDGTVEIGKAIASTGGTVPAGTPVILECTSGETADCQLVPSGAPLFTAPDVSVTSQGAPRATTATNYEGTNLLKGNYYCNTDGIITYTTKNGTSSFNANNYTIPTSTMYVLGITASGRLGFVQATGTAMPANKAWLEYSGTAELVLPFKKPTKPGDVNRDGEVDVNDITAMVNIILGRGNDNYDYEAAELDDNNGITVGDLTVLVNIILEGN